MMKNVSTISKTASDELFFATGEYQLSYGIYIFLHNVRWNICAGQKSRKHHRVIDSRRCPVCWKIKVQKAAETRPVLVALIACVLRSPSLKKGFRGVQEAFKKPTVESREKCVSFGRLEKKRRWYMLWKCIFALPADPRIPKISRGWGCKLIDNIKAIKSLFCLLTFDREVLKQLVTFKFVKLDSFKKTSTVGFETFFKNVFQYFGNITYKSEEMSPLESVIRVRNPRRRIKALVGEVKESRAKDWSLNIQRDSWSIRANGKAISESEDDIEKSLAAQ